MKLLKIFLIVICAIYCCSCKQKSPSGNIIIVTIEPQKFFVDQLVDTLFHVVTMVPEGTSPETYDPSPTQMTQLGEGKAYFCIGHIGFEEMWMDKIKLNNPNLLIYDNSEGIEYITSEHKHEEGDFEHSHAGNVDPHIWSSPKEALIIVRNMYKALVELDASHESVYKNNLVKLEKEIQETDSIITVLLEKTENKSFIIYHPALTYLARDYGLTQYCIETDGKEPSPEQLKQLVEYSKEKGVKVIFIQKEFDEKNAQIIAQETGSRLVVINPLSYQWKEEVIHIAKALSGE